MDWNDDGGIFLTRQLHGGSGIDHPRLVLPVRLCDVSTSQTYGIPSPLLLAERVGSQKFGAELPTRRLTWEVDDRTADYRNDEHRYERPNEMSATRRIACMPAPYAEVNADKQCTNPQKNIDCRPERHKRIGARGSRKNQRSAPSDSKKYNCRHERGFATHPLFLFFCIRFHG